jgi:hypothetical protein
MRQRYTFSPAPHTYNREYFATEFARIQRAFPPTMVRTVRAATTASESDWLILADATGGAFSVTLPVAARAPGMVVSIKRTNGAANAVTIARTASDTIDGAASISLSAQYASRTLVSDGESWHVIASV